MDSQELKQVYMTDDSKRWGMWNREKHIMVTVLWKDYSLLLSKLADLKTTCIKNEKLTAKGYKGHYHFWMRSSLSFTKKSVEITRRT